MAHAQGNGDNDPNIPVGNAAPAVGNAGATAGPAPAVPAQPRFDIQAGTLDSPPRRSTLMIEIQAEIDET